MCAAVQVSKLDAASWGSLFQLQHNFFTSGISIVENTWGFAVSMC